MKAKFEIGQKVYTVIDSEEVEILEIYLTKDGVFYKINTGGRNITVGENELAGSYKDAHREYVLMVQQLNHTLYLVEVSLLQVLQLHIQPGF
jgi:hypothetical protein